LTVTYYVYMLQLSCDAMLHLPLVGVPCTDVTVEGNDTVTCITGIRPPRSTYYPGTSYIWDAWTVHTLQVFGMKWPLN